jgi:hypothetical protein
LSISRPWPDWVREHFSRFRFVCDRGDIGMEYTGNCEGISEDARGLLGSVSSRSSHISPVFRHQPSVVVDHGLGVVAAWHTAHAQCCSPLFMLGRRSARGSRRNVGMCILLVSNHGLVRASRDIGQGTSVLQGAR